MLAGIACSALLVRHYIDARRIDRSGGRPWWTSIDCAALESNPIFETVLSKRVISENDSLVVATKIRRQSDESCRSTLTITAPDFNIRPPDAEKEINLGRGEKSADAFGYLLREGVVTFQL